MQAPQIALILTAIFMLVSLYIGIKVGNKVTTIRDYVLGNKNFSVMALSLTYLATLIGGGTIFGDSVGTLGFVTFISLMAIEISYFIRAKVLPGKMTKFRDCLTLGDMMGKMYGNEAKRFTGFLGIAMCSIYTTIQLTSLGIISEKFMGIDARLGIIIGTIVLAMYSIWGGIRSVVSTDIIQCIMLFITVLLISNAIVSNLGGIDAFINKLPEIKITGCIDKDFYRRLGLFIMWLFLFSEMVCPPLMQRVLMANSKMQVRNMFLSVGAIDTIFRVLVLIISIGGMMIYPNTPANEIIYKCTKELLPEQLYGVIVVGLVAIVASTIDSYMHAGGISLGIDLLDKPVDKKITYSKYGTAIIAVISATMALYNFASFTHLVFVAIQVMSITITCPLILGIFDVMPSKKGFWYACAASIVACIVFTFTLPDVYEPLATLFAMIVNGTVYLIVHYLENGKIVVNTDPTSFPIVKKQKPATLTYIMQAYMGKFSNAFQNYYVLFGIFCLVGTVTPILMYGVEGFSMSTEMIYLKAITIGFCILLITHEAWNESLKKYLPLFYNICITYCLPFVGASMFILTNGRIEWLTNFVISTMFLIMLVDHLAFFVHMIIGVGFAWIIFGKSIILENGISISPSTLYLLVSQMVLATVVGLLFSKKKQAYIHLIDYQKRLSEELEKMKSKDLFEIESSKDKFHKLLGREEVDIVAKLATVEKYMKSQSYNSAALSITHVKEYIKNLIERATDYYRLSVETIDLAQLSSEIEQIFKVDNNHEIYTVLISSKDAISCDKISLLKMITQLLVDQQNEAFKLFQNNNQDIYVYISDSKLMYEIKDIPYYNRTVDAIKITVSYSDHLSESFLNRLHKLELVRPEKITTISFEDVNRKSVEKAVEAHYGIYLRESKGDEAIFSICLPKNIYEIRPETIDIEDPEEKLQLWPAAFELEKDFIGKIQSTYPNLDLGKISQALELIKKYHAHQQRKSGEPYYMHPINVAMLVIDIMQDKDSNVYEELESKTETVIISALLHDILEDTAFHPLDMKVQFGEEVTQTVVEVTKIDFEERQRLLTNGEAFKKLMQQSPAVVCIKLADRLHNILTIDGHPKEEKRKAVAQETLDFFVPPAEKMKLKKLSQELSIMSKYILERGKLAK